MSRPLAGRRVVVTRARAQAEELVAALAGLGAEVVLFPTIRVEPVADPAPLRAAFAELDRYAWVVFTSVNGVECAMTALADAGVEARTLRWPRVAAVGPATAAALEERGIPVELVPDEHLGEAVATALAARGDLGGVPVLLVRAEVARPALPAALQAAGAEVREVAAYRTLPNRADAPRIRALLDRSEVELVTFTSGSTARGFVAQVGAEVGRARVACIGPVTAEAARSLGLPVHIQADPYTVAGLVEAIRVHFEERA